MVDCISITFAELELYYYETDFFNDNSGGDELDADGGGPAGRTGQGIGGPRTEEQRPQGFLRQFQTDQNACQQKGDKI